MQVDELMALFYHQQFSVIVSRTPCTNFIEYHGHFLSTEIALLLIPDRFGMWLILFQKRLIQSTGISEVILIRPGIRSPVYRKEKKISSWSMVDLRKQEE